jgi:hypothetical protein
MSDVATKERIGNMPDDIQTLVVQFLDDAGLGDITIRRVLRHPHTVFRLDLRRVPPKAFAEVGSDPGDDRDVRYAYDLIGAVHPPVILFGPDWLADGKHRCYAAKIVNRGWVEAIDLCETVSVSRFIGADGGPVGWPLLPLPQKPGMKVGGRPGAPFLIHSSV